VLLVASFDLVVSATSFDHWRDQQAGLLECARVWLAEVQDFDAIARLFGRWPPAGVPEDVAARAAVSIRNFFISATALSELPSRHRAQ
jgi:hypothetical protein